MVTNNAINLSSQGVAYYDGIGTFSAPSITNHGIVIGATNNDITTVGPGTAGQVLLSGGVAANPSYVTPTAGTGLTVTTNATTLSYALTTPVSVANGGTGDTTLTAFAVLVGNGTGAVATVGPGTAGQVLLSGGPANPSYVTPTAGTGLTVTTNATTLSYALTTPVSVANGGTGDTTLTAFAVLVGNGTGAVATVGPGTAGQVLLSGGVAANPSYVTPTAGTGLIVTTNATTLSYALSGSGGTVWNDSTSTPVTMVANNGYIADLAGATRLVFNLPSTASLGDTFYVTGRSNAGANTGGWQVTPTATQSIFFGTSTTTATTGNIQSTNQTDSVKIVCTHANTEFTVIDSIGNITVN